jgi:hypothetical protein
LRLYGSIGVPVGMSGNQSSDEGQVSEVTKLDPAEAEGAIYPEDATAGYPDTESGEPDEGNPGPNARPRDNRPGGGPDNDH